MIRQRTPDERDATKLSGKGDDEDRGPDVPTVSFSAAIDLSFKRTPAANAVGTTTRIELFGGPPAPRQKPHGRSLIGMVCR